MRGHEAEANKHRRIAADCAEPLTDSQHPVRREYQLVQLRAALSHELWAEHLLGRVAWSEYLLAERLLVTWSGSEDLAALLTAARAVALQPKAASIATGTPPASGPARR